MELIFFVAVASLAPTAIAIALWYGAALTFGIPAPPTPDQVLGIALLSAAACEIAMAALLINDSK